MQGNHAHSLLAASWLALRDAAQAGLVSTYKENAAHCKLEAPEHPAC